MPQPDYRAQLGEALLQLVDMQAEFEQYKNSAAGVDDFSIREDLNKCHKSNIELSKQITHLKDELAERAKEIAELEAIRIAQSRELAEADNQIKTLQLRIKAQK